MQADCLDAAQGARRATDSGTNAPLHLPILCEAFSLGTRALLATGRTQAAAELANEVRLDLHMCFDWTLRS